MLQQIFLSDLLKIPIFCQSEPSLVLIEPEAIFEHVQDTIMFGTLGLVSFLNLTKVLSRSIPLWVIVTTE